MFVTPDRNTEDVAIGTGIQSPYILLVPFVTMGSGIKVIYESFDFTEPQWRINQSLMNTPITSIAGGITGTMYLDGENIMISNTQSSSFTFLVQGDGSYQIRTGNAYLFVDFNDINPYLKASTNPSMAQNFMIYN